VHNFLSNSQRYLQFEQCYDKRFHNKTMQTFDCTSDVLVACVVLTCTVAVMSYVADMSSDVM